MQSDAKLSAIYQINSKDLAHQHDFAFESSTWFDISFIPFIIFCPKYVGKFCLKDLECFLRNIPFSMPNIYIAHFVNTWHCSPMQNYKPFLKRSMPWNHLHNLTLAFLLSINKSWKILSKRFSFKFHFWTFNSKY